MNEILVLDACARIAYLNNESGANIVQDVSCDLISKDRSESGLRKHEFWANQGISSELRRGECLGLIGKTGAGKTTLLKMLNGLIKPDQGSITMHGRIEALIELGAGFTRLTHEDTKARSEGGGLESRSVLGLGGRFEKNECGLKVRTNHQSTSFYPSFIVFGMRGSARTFSPPKLIST